MFDIGFAELLLIAVVSLVVVGPERLPSAVRTVSLWIGRLRRNFTEIKREIEAEIGADEIRRELHNESIMADLERIKNDGEKHLSDFKQQIDSDIEALESEMLRSDEDRGATGKQPSRTEHD